MKLRRGVVVSLVALAALLSGCGSSYGKQQSPGGSPTTNAPTDQGGSGY